MAVLTLALLIVAAILFGVAACGVGPARPHLGWLAACIATLALIVANWPGA
jgi:hypothetical protein